MIKIEFFHDVICSFCFPMSARMRKITEKYNNIEVIHRSFALGWQAEDFIRGFGSREAVKPEVLNHWAQANQNDDEHRFNIEGMRQTDFNFPISKPGLLATKAAGIIGGDDMYWDVFDRIQNKLFVENKNIEDIEVIEEAVKETADTVKSTDTEVDTIKFEKVASLKENGIFYFFQYFGYIIISILLVGISPILISFRQADLSARISCSSYSRTKQSIGIGLGCLTYSLAQWLVMVICSIIFYGAEQAFSRNGILCLINSFIYTIVVIAITLLVGSFKLSSSALSLVANVIGLGTSFLCGIFVPLWLLSDKVITFSKFLPTYWFIRNNNMISGFSGETVTMTTFWNNIFIQLLFAVAIFCIYLVLNISRKRKSIK